VLFLFRSLRVLPVIWFVGLLEFVFSCWFVEERLVCWVMAYDWA
jgi:hypothetical protein